MSAFIDRTGMKYGGSVVIKLSPNRHGSLLMWTCQCSCGKKFDVVSARLQPGSNVSCGCRKGGHLNHGMSGTKEYKIWKKMRERCLNPNCKEYKHYGGRGIFVSEQWNNFQNFINDMGKIPGNGFSIERKNVNGNYEKENCVWIETKRQARNKRNTIWLTYRGETKVLIDWAEHLGVSFWTLRRRRDLGWSPEAIIETPVRRHQNSVTSDPRGKFSRENSRRQ